MEEMKIDTQELASDLPMTEVVFEAKEKQKDKKEKKTAEPQFDGLVSCLRNEKIIVRFIPREKTGITDPKHPFYGGMADNSFVDYTVPLLRSGSYKDPLTKAEKEFLEAYMGLDEGSLSIYNKVDNYWDNFYVRLTKVDSILDLSDPNDYIKYKVLLINTDSIAPSLKTLRDMPLATYRFVIVSETETYNSTLDKTNTKSKCWKEFGKVEDDADVLRCIIHTIEGRKPTANTKIEFLRDRIDKLIDSDSKLFLNVITDPLLKIKVLIEKAWEKGIIDKRGDYYYFNNEPLCGKNENPTFTIAAKYLSLAKNQEIRFAIEGKLK